MGIPKFFRYIAQRWPLSSQQVNDSVIPEFDNLYLDMNSIIHMCTHANADNVGHLDDEQIYRSISNYIEHSFTVINPQKVFFMAIDGVAPRAKMNQQRSRRFRSALDAEQRRQKAAQEGIALDDDPFDSSAITPGTEFMAQITLQLKYFIARKITEDSRWQKCRIILSGHEVPGEGEHKIMRFIRSLKSQPDYDPNTRHCLYGLDADLIMLGLSTHEPHFSLSREEVTFGRKIQFQSAELSEQRFILLHLSLVRDYSELESTEGDFDEKPDFERELDDFILIMFFIGNDFLPELPMLLVNEGAIPVIFDTYKTYLSKSKNKYLSTNGKVDFLALKEWMGFMQKYQIDKFEEQTNVTGWFQSQMDSLAAESGAKDDEIVLTANQADIFQDSKRFMRKALQKENEEASMEVPLEEKFVNSLADQTGFSYENRILKLDKGKVPVPEALRILRIYDTARIHNPARAQEYGEKLIQWKNRYYNRKFGDSYESEIVKHASRKVSEGLQWVLNYYYGDTPSWSWFYDNHYAPMITELISEIGEGFEPKFDIGTPFKPFEQLMSVLPDRSAALLPPALRPLVLEPNSPIIDFYPHTFQLDKNGKKADWEAVVLIPFIDEERSLKYVRPIEESSLTDAEKLRNSQGAELEFFHDPNESYAYRSPLHYCPDIEGCTSVARPLAMPKHELRYGRLPGSYSGKNALAGFPSSHTLKFDWDLESGKGVKIFEMPSRDASVIIKVAPAAQKIKSGQTVYVNWPFLQEAEVTKVRAPDSSLIWHKTVNTIVGDMKRVGVDIGETKALVGYRVLQGLVRQKDGSYIKDFEGPDLFVPAQLVVSKVAHQDSRFQERKAIPLSKEFPVNSSVLLLLAKFYGFPATVIAHSGNTAELEATVTRYRDPMFSIAKSIVEHEHMSIRWWPSNGVAKSIDVDTKFLLNLTSRFMVNVDGKDVNVALQLRKHASSLVAQGLSRMTYRKEWEFSDRGVASIMSYLKQFGESLKKAARSLQPKLDPEVYAKIRQWLQEHTADIKFMPSSAVHSTQKSVRVSEQNLINQKPTVSEKVLLKQVEKGASLSPSEAHHALRSQHFKLGDRVVSALDHGKVPLFSRGIVVGVNAGKTSQSTSLDIVWDHTFSAGSTLDERLSTNRGLTVPAQSVLNLSYAQSEYHHGRQPILTRISAKVDTHNTPATKPKVSQKEESSRYAPALPHDDWAAHGKSIAVPSNAVNSLSLNKLNSEGSMSNTGKINTTNVGASSEHVDKQSAKKKNKATRQSKATSDNSAGSDLPTKTAQAKSPRNKKSAVKRAEARKNDKSSTRAGFDTHDFKNLGPTATTTSDLSSKIQESSSSSKSKKLDKKLDKSSEDAGNSHSSSENLSNLPELSHRHRDPEAAKKIMSTLFANN